MKPKENNEWEMPEDAENTIGLSRTEPSVEFALYNSVRAGDLEAVRVNCARNPFLELNGAGTLSKDPVQNIKYHHVIAAALIARLCIDAGMEKEQAYGLSDFYIRKLDSLQTAEAVAELHDRMVLDYAERMYRRTHEHASRPVKMCIDYIYEHIRERITVESLVAHTGLSSGYLSRLFKKETGISVSAYIREKKLEKAQNLLRFGDYSMIDIANYLSFSSQSHFIQLFRKSVGVTPKKYRDLYFRSDWKTVEF